MSLAGKAAPADGEAALERISAALFHSLGVDGVHARTALYEEVSERLGLLISRERDPAAEVLRFPPVMSRSQLERSGYLKSFPNLLGCVSTLHGSEAEIRAAVEGGGAKEWTAALQAADLVLSPAACYPVYPLAARRGRVPRSGLLFDVAADCFRHEPSKALNRLQSFRMREFVCIDTPARIASFREYWMGRAERLVKQLALPYQLAVASDPFFGRVGNMMAVAQLQQSLKFELLIPYHATAVPTACMSFNYHREHFGVTWELTNEAGEVAHTSCIAFGVDRLTLALFCVHGLEIASWPDGARRALGY
jgi:seryl-tRNA synthetase